MNNPPFNSPFYVSAFQILLTTLLENDHFSSNLSTKGDEFNIHSLKLHFHTNYKIKTFPRITIFFQVLNLLTNAEQKNCQPNNKYQNDNPQNALSFFRLHIEWH